MHLDHVVSKLYAMGQKFNSDTELVACLYEMVAPGLVSSHLKKISLGYIAKEWASRSILLKSAKIQKITLHLELSDTEYSWAPSYQDDTHSLQETKCVIYYIFFA